MTEGITNALFAGSDQVTTRHGGCKGSMQELHVLPTVVEIGSCKRDAMQKAAL